MWGGFTAPNGLSLMAFDVPPERPFDRGTDSVFVSVRSDSPAEITRCYEALSEGGRSVLRSGRRRVAHRCTPCSTTGSGSPG